MSKSNSTKQKILDAANSLFANNGFAATSMREIASSADVNLAAINYHFKNKDNLYWQVFDHNYKFMEERISEIGTSTDDIEDFTLEVFRFFMSGKSPIMNTFKIFLSDNVGSPEESEELNCDEKFGPPGQLAFLDKITKKVPKASEESQRWVMKMIFSLLVHFGVIMHTTAMKTKSETDSELKVEFLENSLLHSLRAHLDYLKNNKNLFKS